MEPRKQQEIQHYDKNASGWLSQKHKDWSTDVHEVKHEVFSSYTYFHSLIQKYAQGKRVLDYGCGNGLHSLVPARAGAKEVIGIDLSEKSLDIARERARRAHVNIAFKKMDCEHLNFPDNSFDIIIDGGTFSSLDLDKALPELARVLKPEGMVIGIETLGHNLIFNLKRRLNVARGVRTKWAADHIFKVNDFTRVRKYFNTIHARYFHLISIFLQPFSRIPGGKLIVKIADLLDSLLLSLPFIKRQAFKIVFTFSKKKTDLP